MTETLSAVIPTTKTSTKWSDVRQKLSDEWKKAGKADALVMEDLCISGAAMVNHELRFNFRDIPDGTHALAWNIEPPNASCKVMITLNTWEVVRPSSATVFFCERTDEMIQEIRFFPTSGDIAINHMVAAKIHPVLAQVGAIIKPTPEKPIPAIRYQRRVCVDPVRGQYRHIDELFVERKGSVSFCYNEDSANPFSLAPDVHITATASLPSDALYATPTFVSTSFHEKCIQLLQMQTLKQSLLDLRVFV